MSTATPPPSARIALAVEPRLLHDTLATVLADHGFAVIDAADLVGGCEVLLTSDDPEVVDLRAQVVIHVGDGSTTTSISDLVARIVGTSPNHLPAG